MTIPEPKLDDLYREVVLDHYRNPRGRDPVTEPHACNEGFNPVCGDEVRVAIRVEGGRIEQVEVKGRGWSISVASGSIMAEHLSGMRLEDVWAIYAAFKSMMHGKEIPGEVDLGDLEALEGVKQFPVRIKCALLPWVTMGDALESMLTGTGRPSGISTTESEEEDAQLSQARREIERPGIPCEPGEESVD
jgi:nitrogen fixation NifU-like protein